SWGSDKAELFQKGLIPLESRSLRFATTRDPLLKALGLRPEDWTLSLLLDNISVPYFALKSTTNYTLWGADISSLAGTISEIRFSLHTTQPSQVSDSGIAIGLDGIEFSPTPLAATLQEPILTTDGGFLFMLHGQFGVSYTVQFSTN